MYVCVCCEGADAPGPHSWPQRQILNIGGSVASSKIQKALPRAPRNVEEKAPAKCCLRGGGGQTFKGGRGGGWNYHLALWHLPQRDQLREGGPHPFPMQTHKHTQCVCLPANYWCRVKHMWYMQIKHWGPWASVSLVGEEGTDCHKRGSGKHLQLNYVCIYVYVCMCVCIIILYILKIETVCMKMKPFFCQVMEKCDTISYILYEIVSHFGKCDSISYAC